MHKMVVVVWPDRVKPDHFYFYRNRYPHIKRPQGFYALGPKHLYRHYTIYKASQYLIIRSLNRLNRFLFLFYYWFLIPERTLERR